MASLNSLSPIIILILALFLILISPSFSSPRRILDRQYTPHSGFRISLRHIDSGKNLTKFQLIQHSIKRSKHRLQRFKEVVVLTNSETLDLKAPVYPGNGEFLMKLSIGTPPKPFSAIMDTGSDLIWTQCKPCKKCYSQPTPIFDPKNSLSYSKLPCSSNLCRALPRPSCNNGCKYIYQYGDGSLTQGDMATETFTFDMGSVPKVGFGCGANNVGGGFDQGAGLIGLGRGPLSLVSQLKEPKFSYCLTSIDDSTTSTLLMGSLVKEYSSSNSEIKTTPLVKNPSYASFYYLSLEGITVGGNRLPIDKSVFAINDGEGGLIIDSGTTITYLEEDVYDMVKRAFIEKIKLKVDETGAGGLDLCFQFPKNTQQVEVPNLVFHFQGADLDLPSENYFIADSSMGLMCLAMGSSNGMSIFGNVQQQNMMVVHDLTKETLSFVPAQCDKV